MTLLCPTKDSYTWRTPGAPTSQDKKTRAYVAGFFVAVALQSRAGWHLTVLRLSEARPSQSIPCAHPSLHPSLACIAGAYPDSCSRLRWLLRPSGKLFWRFNPWSETTSCVCCPRPAGTRQRAIAQDYGGIIALTAQRTLYRWTSSKACMHPRGCRVWRTGNSLGRAGHPHARGGECGPMIADGAAFYGKDPYPGICSKIVR